MKLLFLTQVLDRQDAVLGFVSRWVEGLARAAERVRVVALEVGDVSGLPDNVDVREVGRRGVLGRYLRYRRFLSEALGRDRFDAVLAHMVPRYALVAAGPARRRGAGLYLWYTHKGVDRRLLRAERVVEKIFTASPESLRLATPKKVVTGHGIDLDHFAPRPGEAGGNGAPARLLSVGRLTQAKDPLTVLEALARLVAEGRDVHLDWVGGALAAGDGAYGERVRQRIAQLGLAQRVVLHGPVPYLEVPARYRAATLFVNASLTGSVDKVVLEAMASQRPVLSCNESFRGVFAPLGAEGEALLFAPGDPVDLSSKVALWLDRGEGARAAMGAKLARIVSEHHEVDRLMARLVADMDAAKGARGR